jgi:two-component sensor histidine kinase
MGGAVAELSSGSGLRTTVRRVLGQAAITDLQNRVAALEGEIEELRRQNLRLAEIADVVQELLVPLASRDQARVDAALESFAKSL